jgi:hypothetical protein
LQIPHPSQKIPAVNTTTGSLEMQLPLTRAEDAFDPFVSTINAAELDLLQSLVYPALMTKVTPEFIHLRNLGLIFIDPGTGFAQVTPLGKSWLWSQNFASSYD